MTKKTISDAVTNISAEYIEKAADYSAKTSLQSVSPAKTSKSIL